MIKPDAREDQAGGLGGRRGCVSPLKGRGTCRGREGGPQFQRHTARNRGEGPGRLGHLPSQLPEKVVKKESCRPALQAGTKAKGGGGIASTPLVRTRSAARTFSGACLRPVAAPQGCGRARASTARILREIERAYGSNGDGWLKLAAAPFSRAGELKPGTGANSDGRVIY